MIYASIAAVLEQYDADVNVAEAHGIATGMLCVYERIDANQWLQEIISQQQELDTDDRALLLSLFAKTAALLRSDVFAFDLFLPDDDSGPSEQAEALRSWCQGFLFGIGYGHSNASWPGDSGEILKDVVEFTKLDGTVLDEEDERALMEINEYLRAAVLLLRDDLRGNAEQKH